MDEKDHLFLFADDDLIAAWEIEPNTADFIEREFKEQYSKIMIKLYANSELDALEQEFYEKYILSTQNAEVLEFIIR